MVTITEVCNQILACWEIYRRTHDVYGKAFFSQTNVYEWVDWKHIDSPVKKKFLV